uniref:B1340F09.9 protein n=1 Tax=Oryza sativa subsp. japonica TaxID=39947 RepID=Q6MW74_ORYSJ|nr:B1340F09.9 [Oryza sativa Japonica Group]
MGPVLLCLAIAAATAVCAASSGAPPSPDAAAVAVGSCPTYSGSGYSSASDGGNQEEYDPNKENPCKRSCGSMSIPFPFALLSACSGSKRFLLNCTSNKTLIGIPPAQYQVINISLDDGVLFVNKPSNLGDIITTPTVANELHDFDFSGSQGIWRWAVANQTCHTARTDQLSYACVSNNSLCVHRSTGYHCKCSLGYGGNAYIEDGCEDIDECSLPNFCNGNCQNFLGSYRCSHCPRGSIFDPAKRVCIYGHGLHPAGLLIGLSCGIGVLFLVVGLILFVRRWRRHMQRKIRREYFQKNKGLLLEQLMSSDENVAHDPKIFSLEELEKATDNFHSTRILGCGGHGTVYKGILLDQRVVAIKKSRIVEQNEIDQFINEVAILSQIVHRNVVKLFGCCLVSKVPLLVYEFISNGTLYDLLHGEQSTTFSLTWEDSIRISLEVASALSYLHSAASIPIFHRDVKSANILLNDNYTSKVSDFGASRSISIDETRVVTIVQGTFGYLDPEYFHTCQLTEKSDVYSFGVILVEILTRKKPIIVNCFGENQNLGHCFLQTLQHGTIMEIVDPQIAKEANESEINEMASLAEICLRIRGEERPKMKEVELRLQLLRAMITERSRQELLRNNGIGPSVQSNSSTTSVTRSVVLRAVKDLLHFLPLEWAELVT